MGLRINRHIDSNMQLHGRGGTPTNEKKRESYKFGTEAMRFVN